MRVGLNARLTAGGPFLLRETGVLDRLEAVDLVVTGEGAIDAQTLHGKIVAALAREATRRGVPVVALGGQVTRSLEAPFPFLALSLYSSPMPMADAMRQASARLELAASDLGRLLQIGARLPVSQP